MSARFVRLPPEPSRRRMRRGKALEKAATGTTFQQRREAELAVARLEGR